MKYDYLTRVELDDTDEPGDGFLYLDARGRVGESRSGMLYAQHYGFASRPPKGSVGVKLALGQHQSMPVIVGIEHPDHRPKLQAGEAAFYDHNGNIIKLMKDGAVMDFQDRTIELKGGDWKIIGPVRIEGPLHVTGDITTDGTNPNKHSH